MRADKFLAEKFGSRTKAQKALAEGKVLRGGRPLSPSDEVSEGDFLVFCGEEDFVSMGGRKLARALDVFHEDVAGKTYADLGASTGGFTDCLLRRGARRVYCVDVGESLLDGRISSDPRVVVMDRTNARYLTPENFPEALDGVVSDLSFISLRLVLPAIRAILPAQGHALVLFKPQFECGKDGVGKSGILPVSRHSALLEPFYDFCIAQELAPVEIVNAPILPKKNVEYVVKLVKGGTPVTGSQFLALARNFSRE